MSNQLNFDDLYKNYYLFVFRICRKIVGDSLAEDVTQDTFIKIWKHLKKFKGQAKLATWIYRIAVNECLMTIRDDNRKKRVYYRVPLEEVHPTATAIKPFQAVAEKLTITKAIEEMSSGYRLYFILHGIEGYEHQEIAKALNRHVGNSKSQYHRAVKILRKKLNARR